MAAQFEPAVLYVLKNEGGFTDDPLDHGGATNFGITQSSLAQWRGCSVSTDDVRDMTVDEAKLIYEKKYWHPNNLDLFTQQPVATCIFDQGVLNGVVTGAKMGQKAANICGLVLAVDGHIGPKSIAALNEVEPMEFLHAYVSVVKARYDAIVTNTPSQYRFYKGWMNRANRLLKLV